MLSSFRRMEARSQQVKVRALSGPHLLGGYRPVKPSSPVIPRSHQDRPSSPTSCFGWRKLSRPRGLHEKLGRKS